MNDTTTTVTTATSICRKKPNSRMSSLSIYDIQNSQDARRWGNRLEDILVQQQRRRQRNIPDDYNVDNDNCNNVDNDTTMRFDDIEMRISLLSSPSSSRTDDGVLRNDDFSGITNFLQHCHDVTGFALTCCNDNSHRLGSGRSYSNNATSTRLTLNDINVGASSSIPNNNQNDANSEEQRQSKNEEIIVEAKCILQNIMKSIASNDGIHNLYINGRNHLKFLLPSLCHTIQHKKSLRRFRCSDIIMLLPETSTATQQTPAYPRNHPSVAAESSIENILLLARSIGSNGSLEKVYLSLSVSIFDVFLANLLQTMRTSNRMCPIQSIELCLYSSSGDGSLLITVTLYFTTRTIGGEENTTLLDKILCRVWNKPQLQELIVQRHQQPQRQRKAEFLLFGSLLAQEFQEYQTLLQCIEIRYDPCTGKSSEWRGNRMIPEIIYAEYLDIIVHQLTCMSPYLTTILLDSFQFRSTEISSMMYNRLLLEIIPKKELYCPNLSTIRLHDCSFEHHDNESSNVIINFANAMEAGKIRTLMLESSDPIIVYCTSNSRYSYQQLFQDKYFKELLSSSQPPSTTTKYRKHNINKLKLNQNTPPTATTPTATPPSLKEILFSYASYNELASLFSSYSANIQLDVFDLGSTIGKLLESLSSSTSPFYHPRRINTTSVRATANRRQVTHRRQQRERHGNDVDDTLNLLLFYIPKLTHVKTLRFQLPSPDNYNYFGNNSIDVVTILLEAFKRNASFEKIDITFCSNSNCDDMTSVSTTQEQQHSNNCNNSHNDTDNGNTAKDNQIDAAAFIINKVTNITQRNIALKEWMTKNNKNLEENDDDDSGYYCSRRHLWPYFFESSNELTNNRDSIFQQLLRLDTIV